MRNRSTASAAPQAQAKPLNRGEREPPLDFCPQLLNL
jgi:hypothetical protein